MFGMGMPEILVILAVALIVIGPKKLPDLARSLGRAMGEFKRATNDFRRNMEIDEELSGVKKAYSDMEADLRREAGRKPPEGADPSDAKPADAAAPPSEAARAGDPAAPASDAAKPSHDRPEARSGGTETEKGRNG